ncbi:MAG: hypothetical protein J6M42_03080 [Clostridia bacterium]|nr:hypothetical protein [Clostridia bacterium]
MKQTNDKKQDLLLDALSCIDEDILERGLALRDGTAAPAPKAAESAPKTTRPATVIPPLYDLTRQPEKPPKKNPWRVLAVVAAACLLLCVVPMSMWMVGSMTKNEAGDDPTLDGIQNGILDGGPNPENRPGELPDDAPGDPMDSIPEAEAPEIGESNPLPEETALSTEAPMEEPTEGAIEGVTEPETIFEPEELVWSTVSKTDEMAEYTATGHNGAAITLRGTRDAALGTPFPAEDEMALRMVGQWLASLYTLDYGYHFPLFYESFVHEVFIKEAVRYGSGYRDAIQRMEEVAANLLLIDEVYLTLHLDENTLLTGEELESYRDTRPAIQTSRSFDPAAITAVRRVRVSGNIEIDGFTPAESVSGEVFYLYEYEGAWYLDEDFMDGDLSIDLLGTRKAETGFYKTHTATGTVVTIRGNYLYLDTGKAFRMDSAAVHNQTDGGEWHKAEVRVGNTVTVTHYSLTLEGLLSVVDPEQAAPDTEWELSTATRIDIVG